MTPRRRVSDEAVHRQESLRVSGGFEPPHLSLALAGRLMRDFGSIVLVLRRACTTEGIHDAVGSRVAAKLVGDQTPGARPCPFNSLRKKRSPHADRAWAEEDVDHVAVLVDGPPEILLAPWMFTNSSPSARCRPGVPAGAGGSGRTPDRTPTPLPNLS